MTGDAIRPAPYAVLLLALSLAAGCATTQNTLAQDLAWERAEMCKDVALTSNIQIDRVEPDGRIWWWSRTGGRTAFDECLKKAAVEQAQRRVTPAPPLAVASTAPPIVGSSTGGAAATAEIPMPSWKVGDEWAYRQETPDSALTFVWSVDDIEKVEGVEHYVVKSGTRRIYFRTADRAVTLEKDSGAVANRFTPAWIYMAWPLSAGKTWETRFSEERVEERVTEEIIRTCEVGTEETLTVPAGTFATIPITCKNQRTGALVSQQWYSPVVKHLVREVWWLRNGRRLRELIAYRLR